MLPGSESAAPFLRRGRGRAHRRRRADPAVGGAPHRRDLADAQRPPRAAGRDRAVRAVRNPLYLGNIALWVGFAIAARLLWLAPIILVLLALEYHAIVRWEEPLLESRLGEAYRDYAARVPRWIPSFNRGRPRPADRATEGFSWSDDAVQRARDARRDRCGVCAAVAKGSFSERLPQIPRRHRSVRPPRFADLQHALRVRLSSAGDTAAESQ